MSTQTKDLEELHTLLALSSTKVDLASELKAVSQGHGYASGMPNGTQLAIGLTRGTLLRSELLTHDELEEFDRLIHTASTRWKLYHTNNAAAVQLAGGIQRKYG